MIIRDEDDELVSLRGLLQQSIPNMENISPGNGSKGKKQSRQQRHHGTVAKEKQTNLTRLKSGKKVPKEKSSCSTKQPSFIRTGSTLVPPATEASVPTSPTPDENIKSDSKLGCSADIIKKPPLKCIQREFTFTGYDIMTDVEPKKVIKETALQKRDRENVQKYLKACKQLDMVPSSYISRHINDKNLVIKSQPLGPNGVKALCVSLVNNHMVEKLDLEDNAIESEGAICIAEMLTENDSIIEINLAGNLIGRRGVAALTYLLSGGRKIYTLDISGSGIDDNDVKVLADLIEKGKSLKELNISHNGASETGAIDLGRAIARNDTLEDLDMSWNHIRGKGAYAISLGIKKNVGLKFLNLAWNGFANTGAEHVGKALVINRTLRILDISNNRIGIDGVKGLVKGLQQNEGLSTLKMGQNPFSPEVAFTILRAIENSEKCVLTMLDISDIVVRPEFLDKWDEIKRTRILPLRIMFGPVMQAKAAPDTEDEVIDWRDPVMRMFKFMHDKGYRVIDLLKRLDKDRSMSVDRKEFKMGLVAENIPMTEYQLDQVVSRLDTDKDGEVDMGELMRGERDFRKKMKARMRKMLITTKPDPTMARLMEIEDM